MCGEAPKCDVLLVIGDSARVGNDVKAWLGLLERFSLEEENENGLRHGYHQHKFPTSAMLLVDLVPPCKIRLSWSHYGLRSGQPVKYP